MLSCLGANGVRGKNRWTGQRNRFGEEVLGTVTKMDYGN